MLKYCKVCKRNVEKLTRDHIIPKSIVFKLHQMLEMKTHYGPHGWNNTNNYRMICKQCNENKADKLDWTEPWTREFMQHAIDRINYKLKTWDK